jgi:hypothetical protein
VPGQFRLRGRNNKEIVVPFTRPPYNAHSTRIDQVELSFQPSAFARSAATILLDAAAQDGAAMARARDLILSLARTAGPIFVELLIGEITLAGLQRHDPTVREPDYLTAEHFARCALSRFIPELRIGDAPEGGRS